RMDLGKFLSKFAGPILSQVRSALEPVKPIIDLLTAPIPVISDLAGTNISLLSLAELLDPDIEAQPFIDAYQMLYTLVGSIPGSPRNNLILHFGDFDLSNVDLRTTPLSDIDPTQDDVLDPPAEDIDDQLDDLGPEGAFAAQLNTSASSSFKFQMPIVSKDAPQMIFGIFSGKPADLFTFDMTALKFMFNYTQEFPVFGPIDATLTGEFDANFHFVFGFDTLGIQEYFADPDKTHIQDIFDGFYLAAAPALPVVVLHGGIAAGLGV